MKVETRPRTRHTLWLIVVVMAMTVVGGVTAGEEEDLKWGFHPKLNLTAIVPWGHNVAINNASGLALTLHMTAFENRMLGIGVTDFPPVYPRVGEDGWIVFDDPDGCPSFLAFGFQTGIYEDIVCNGGSADYPNCVVEPLSPDPCPPSADLDALLDPWSFDETWLQFQPGTSVPYKYPDAVDESKPLVWGFHNSGWALKEVGPDLGTGDDQYGYGSWSLLPGLVVLADHGPGVLVNHLHPFSPVPSYLTNPAGLPVLSSFFDRSSTLKARNLAGFFQSVGYTLLSNDRAWQGWGQTTLTAQLVAPRYLFTPVMLKDNQISVGGWTDDYGQPCGPGDSAYRLDGGPLTCTPWNLMLIDSILNETLVTVRIFVVDGDAPDTVFDMDGNGILDIHDVKAMEMESAPGRFYEPLTRQETIRFYQHHEIECGVPFDFDNDGMGGTCGAGARAGGITGVPR